MKIDIQRNPMGIQYYICDFNLSDKPGDFDRNPDLIEKNGDKISIFRQQMKNGKAFYGSTADLVLDYSKLEDRMRFGRSLDLNTDQSPDDAEFTTVIGPLESVPALQITVTGDAATEIDSNIRKAEAAAAKQKAALAGIDFNSDGLPDMARSTNLRYTGKAAYIQIFLSGADARMSPPELPTRPREIIA